MKRLLATVALLSACASSAPTPIEPCPRYGEERLIVDPYRPIIDEGFTEQDAGTLQCERCVPLVDEDRPPPDGGDLFERVF